MTTQSIALRLVQLCREGKFDQAQEELYADNARSIENDGTSGPLGDAVGMEAIRAKGKAFYDSCEQIHSATVSDPLVASPFFSVAMTFDATYKTGGRRKTEEICLYEVANDKIVREQFFYS